MTRNERFALSALQRALHVRDKVRTEIAAKLKELDMLDELVVEFMRQLAGGTDDACDRNQGDTENRLQSVSGQTHGANRQGTEHRS